MKDIKGIQHEDCREIAWIQQEDPMGLPGPNMKETGEKQERNRREIRKKQE